MIPFSATLDVIVHERRDCRGVEEHLATHRCATGLDDVGVGTGFQHVAGRAGLERLEQKLLAVVHRQHQDAQFGFALVQFCCRLDTCHARHGDIENREVDVRLESHLHGFGAILCLGHDLEVGFGVEHFAKA